MGGKNNVAEERVEERRRKRVEAQSHKGLRGVRG